MSYLVHVHPDSLALAPDLFGRKEDVKPCPAAEIDDSLSLIIC